MLFFSVGKAFLIVHHGLRPIATAVINYRQRGAAELMKYHIKGN